MSLKVELKGIIIFLTVFAIVVPLESRQKGFTRKWSRPHQYILGGAEAPPNKFPFLANIQVPDPEDDDQYNVCGGSIIQHGSGSASDPIRYKILTAAHCFDHILESKKPNLNDLVIDLIMGVNNVVTQLSQAKVVKVKYGIVKIHPNYDADTNDNDLAIVPLPVDFKPVAGKIEVIGLAPASDKDRNYAGVGVEAAGWGVTGPSGEDSDQLLFISSTILSDDVCTTAITPDLPVHYNTNFLCIDGTGNKGTCHGDSGGPMVDTTAKLVVGVASFRLTPVCEGPRPSYSIRVVKYLVWINSTI